MLTKTLKRSVMLWGRRLHLALALFTLVPLISLSLSGLALVYALPLEKTLWPEHWRVASHAQPPSLNHAVHAVEQHTQQSVNAVYLNGNNEAWQMVLANGQQANVDPNTGAVLRLGQADDFLYGWLMHWHRRLLAGPDLQPWATNLLSATSLILMANIIIGLVLWLTPGARRKRMRLRNNLKPRAFNYQWHSVPAIVLAGPLLLVAITGVSFHWPGLLRTPLTTALNQPVQGPDFSIPAPAANNARNLDWDNARSLAQQALPSAVIKRLYRATEAAQPAKVRLQMPSESHPYSWVWLDAPGRQILGVFNAETTNAATQLWHLRYNIHIGNFAGPVVLASWLLVAVLPLLSVCTGFRMWWLRRRKGARQTAASAGNAQAGRLELAG